MRRPLVTAALLTAALLPAPAVAAQPKPCKAADLRYPFQPGGPRTFGVLRLTITRGTCATARRVAKAWGKAFEANIAGGSVKRPRRAAGFTFTELAVTQPQEYRLRGRKGATSIRFDYRVPNG
jgi:hypothetical protein